MKNSLIAVAGAVVALSLPVLAEDMPAMKMDGQPKAGTASGQAATAQASGTVKAIDQQKGVVTLAHSAVPSLKWPPMTMGFKATADQLKGLKVGDKVTFEFRVEGMDATLTSIKPMQ